MKAAHYCVPYALAKVSGRTSSEIAEMLIEDGGHSRRKVAFRPSEYIPLLKSLGIAVTADFRPHVALKTWDRQRRKKGDNTTWLLRVSSHIMVYRRGALYDNMIPAGISAMLISRSGRRIKQAWQVSGWSELNPHRDLGEVK